LSQVCCQWRLATLCTPSMWRFIHVNLKSFSQSGSFTGTTLMPQVVQRSIEKSGVCPLELSFSNLGSDNALNIIVNLLTKGSDTAKRVERLEIGLAGAAFLPFLSVLQHFDTSNLKELVLYHTGYFTLHETIPPEVLVTLQHTPNLWNLSLGRIQWDAPTEFVFPNITTLSVDLGHENEALLLRTLSSFPNLSALILQCTDHIKLSDSWEPIPKATLPSLKSITFDPRICHYSLHRLDAPALNIITAKGFSRLSPRFLAYLPRPTAFSILRLERFNPEEDTRLKSTDSSPWTYKSLEQLKVEWTSSFIAGIPGFVACLRNHPEISTLELADCTIDDKYLSCLAESTKILPNLTRLALSNCPNVSRTLLDLIGSYRAPLLRHQGDLTIQYITQ
ncbi:hypothetical protein CPB86DRAFT_697789, partial [Serendipita vermifera]